LKAVALKKAEKTPKSRAGTLRLVRPENLPSLEALSAGKTEEEVKKGRGAAFLEPVKWLAKLLLSAVFLLWIFILGVLVGRGSLINNSHGRFFPALFSFNEAREETAADPAPAPADFSEIRALSSAPSPRPLPPLLTEEVADPDLAGPAPGIPESPAHTGLPGPLPLAVAAAGAPAPAPRQTPTPGVQASLKSPPPAEKPPVRTEASAGAPDVFRRPGLSEESPFAIALTGDSSLASAKEIDGGSSGSLTPTAGSSAISAAGNIALPAASALPTENAADSARGASAAAVPNRERERRTDASAQTEAKAAPEKSREAARTDTAAPLAAAKPQNGTSPESGAAPKKDAPPKADASVKSAAAPKADGAPKKYPQPESAAAAPKKAPSDKTAYWPRKPKGTGLYTVQLASPKEEDAARRLVDDFRKKGLDAYYYPSSGRFFVRAGRFATEAEAGRAKIAMEAAGAVKPYVSKLNPD
jgi:hypothetical protein